MKIGFIGLGIMGESMCARIIQAKHDVVVFDVDAAKIDAMVALGARKATDIQQLTTLSEMIIVMVTNSQQVQAVLQAILGALQPASLVIDMSTIDPLTSQQLAQQVAAKSCQMIDAPVVKSKAAAISGELGILVGGDKAAYERALPVLHCMGREVIHLGPNGSGLAMKLIHNLLVAQIQYGVNEALILADKAGLDFDNVIRSIKAGGGQNFYLDGKADSIKKRDFTPKFPFEHMHKDLKLALDMADSMGLNLHGAQAALDIYEKGMQQNLARQDFSASYQVAEKIIAG